MLQYQARRCRLGLAQCLIWIVFPVTGPTPARRSRVSLWLRLCCATALAWHVPAHTARADDTIFINEVLPDYVNGPGNWIELHNTSASASVSLDFWQLDTGGDANAGVYYIGPDTTIPAGGYLVFERSTTSLSLAKSGTVRLLNLEGTVVDQVNYVVTEDGASIARVPNGSATWMEVSKPTKGAANAASTSALAPTANTHAYANAFAYSNSHTYANTHANTHANAYSNTHAFPDARAHSDSYANTYANARSYSHAHCNSHTHTYTYSNTGLFTDPHAIASSLRSNCSAHTMLERFGKRGGLQ